MRLEDAFKKSDDAAAWRTVNNIKVYIFLDSKEYLNFTGEVTLRILSKSVSYYHTYPHLGALFNSALQDKRIEVQRYANDWQPLSKPPINHTVEVPRPANNWQPYSTPSNPSAYTDDYMDDEDEIEEDVLGNSSSVKTISSDRFGLYGTTNGEISIDLDEELEQDYLEPFVIRGLDGRIEYNADDGW